MSTQENKSLVRRYHEGVWNRNHGIFDELLAPDCVFHGAGGPAELKAIIAEDFQGFPDMTFTIHDMVAEDDRVVTRWTLSGTHQGIWNGIAPTNKSMAFTGMTMNRVAAGRIVEDWFEADFLGMLRQIGAVPTNIGSADERTGGAQ